jgi:hypothetical protein
MIRDKQPDVIMNIDEILDALKKEEERKRDAAYNPALRWRHIQETITWAETSLPPEQRRNRPRWHPSEKRREA